MLPALAACPASRAHLYCLSAAPAGHRLGPVIVCESREEQRRRVGRVELSCGNGPGFGRWQLWPAGKWTHARCPFLGAVLIHIPLAPGFWEGGGLGNVGVEPGSWREAAEGERVLSLWPLGWGPRRKPVL